MNKNAVEIATLAILNSCHSTSCRLSMSCLLCSSACSSARSKSAPLRRLCLAVAPSAEEEDEADRAVEDEVAGGEGEAFGFVRASSASDSSAAASSSNRRGCAHKQTMKIKRRTGERGMERFVPDSGRREARKLRRAEFKNQITHTNGRWSTVGHQQHIT